MGHTNCLLPSSEEGRALHWHFERLLVQGLSGDKFEFDQNGDGPARYNIIHFKQIEPGKYKWVRVGEYVNGELKWNKSGKPRGLAVSQSPVFLVTSSSR